MKKIISISLFLILISTGFSQKEWKFGGEVFPGISRSNFSSYKGWGPMSDYKVEYRK